MSHNVAYKKQLLGMKRAGWLVPIHRSWFALLDKNGKVRDWVTAIDRNFARIAFAYYRDYGRIPKGYTVERRGPVTKENW